jgi:uncharacterized protein (DUF1330 family)
MDTTLSGACIIGRIRINDAAKWKSYREAVPATLKPFDGVLVARGRDPLILCGDTDETDMVIIRFPSIETVQQWYRSPAYQALIPLRDEAADVTIVGYAV